MPEKYDLAGASFLRPGKRSEHFARCLRTGVPLAAADINGGYVCKNDNQPGDVLLSFIRDLLYSRTSSNLASTNERIGCMGATPIGSAAQTPAALVQK